MTTAPSNPSPTAQATGRPAALAVGVSALLASALSAQTIVEVTPLGGEPVSGQLVSATPKSVVIDSYGQRVEFPADSLPMVEAAGSRLTSEPASTGEICLIDGSIIPLARVVTSREGSVVEFRPAMRQMADGRPLAVAIDAVRSIRLPTAAPGFDELWRDFVSRPTTGDMLITSRRDSGALDYVEGFVEVIGEKSLAVTIDGETINVRRSRIYGIVFAAGVGEMEPVDGVRVVMAGGASLIASKFRLKPSGDIALRTASGLELETPLAELVSIDYSAGRLISLSDLTPTRSTFEPLFGTPRAVANATPWPAHRADRSYWDKPLTLRGTGPAAAGLQVFNKGLALRSGGDVRFRLGSGQRRFQCVAGLDPDLVGPRRFRLLIEADGELVHESKLTHSSAPIDIDLEIDGVDELRFRVERLDSLDGSIHLGHARVLR